MNFRFSTTNAVGEPVLRFGDMCEMEAPSEPEPGVLPHFETTNKIFTKMDKTVEEKFGLDWKNIYSMATDSGANVKAVVKKVCLVIQSEHFCSECLGEKGKKSLC